MDYKNSVLFHVPFRLLLIDFLSLGNFGHGVVPVVPEALELRRKELQVLSEAAKVLQGAAEVQQWIAKICESCCLVLSKLERLQTV